MGKPPIQLTLDFQNYKLIFSYINLKLIKKNKINTMKYNAS